MPGSQVKNKEKELYGTDFYVPAFEIYLGKKKLKGELRRDIMNVSYTDNLEAIDSFNFTVSNWDAEKREFKYLDFDDNPFNVGREIEIWMGYGDNLQSMLFGEITSLTPDFPQSGNPTLSVGGLSTLHRLRTKQETHFYKNKTDGYIAKKIAKRLGLKVGNIEDGDKSTFLAQKSRYDIVFLLERARRIGYEVFVEYGKPGEPGRLHFQKSTNTTRINYILTWGKTLINFRPTLSTADQVSEVTVKGWDPRSKKTITGKATRRDLDTKGLGSRKIRKVVESAFNKRIEMVIDRPIRNKREAKQLAKSKLEQIAKELVKGEGSTIGLPDLRMGSLIMLKSLGDTFEGNYYVTGTTHSIGDGGYTTRFSVRREETSEKA